MSGVLLSRVLGEGDVSSGLWVFEFSHEEVKRVVVSGFIAFFLFIVRAA